MCARVSDSGLNLPLDVWCGLTRPFLFCRKYFNNVSIVICNASRRWLESSENMSIYRMPFTFPVQRMLETVRESWTGVTETLMKPNTMAEFTESLESIHNSPHSAICRSAGCEISMGNQFVNKLQNFKADVRGSLPNCLRCSQYYDWTLYKLDVEVKHIPVELSIGQDK